MPPIWKVEVSNTLLIGEKRARINVADISRIIDFLDSLPINVSNFNFPMYEIINTAKANNLTSYDATYLMLAMHEGLPMATITIKH